MAHVVFNYQMDFLLMEHKSFKKSLKSLKLLNLDCPETRLMVNKIEKEADKIEERIDSFYNDLFDDEGTSLKYYRGYEEETTIERMLGMILLRLAVLSNKVDNLLVRKRI